MTEKTKLIRGILDAATADNLAEAERSGLAEVRVFEKLNDAQ